jgi:hypothetical protein
LEQFVRLAEAVTFGVEIQLQQRVVDEHCESVDLAAESRITTPVAMVSMLESVNWVVPRPARLISANRSNVSPSRPS